MTREIGGVTDLQPLGAGANAFVWRGRDERHDRDVAVKVLKSSGDPDTLRRFARECRAMGRLSMIPNVVSVYTSGATDAEEPYLVMPLMAGSLKQSIAEHGPLDPSVAAYTMLTIARTVHAAHEKGVLHLDLKPANILLDTAGQPHVADFGIAEFMGSVGSMSASMMTPAFASPERFEETKPTPLVDVYALGAMLFALLVGAAPFSTKSESSSPASIMRRIMEEDPPLEMVPATTPTAMTDLIRTAMAKEPSARVPTAMAFADVLQNIIDTQFLQPIEKDEPMNSSHDDHATVARNQITYDDVTEPSAPVQQGSTDSYPIFPFYIVIDVSMSMKPSIGSINSELPFLKREVEEDPIVGDIARFGIITFSSEAKMVLPLSDLLDVEQMPTLAPEKSTNYEAAFEFLRGAIAHDMDWFKSNGAQIYRPAVFFITDGFPDRDCHWQPALQDLIDPGFKYRPNIVAFGFGSASEETLAEIATFKAYAANHGESPSEILRTIARELTRSIMASSQAAAQGQASLAMPEQIPGMHEIPIDLL